MLRWGRTPTEARDLKARASDSTCELQLRERQTKALAEAGHAVEVHLERVRFIDLCKRLPISPMLSHLSEIILESSGRDYLDDVTRLVSVVPEGVLLATRLEDPFPGVSFDDVVSQQCAHRSL